MTASESIESKPLRLEPQLIERPRLLEMLDGSDARIIALLAPAGCGKTTVARQWVTGRNVAHAWYSVGPEGFDVAAVAARIAAAVSTILPGAGERMLTRLSVSTNPEAEAVLLAGFLAREMASWPAGTRLVIDDYQALAVSTACERFVETLVRETPLRLLIASRNRPGWASSRLRLYGELFEVGREELQMTPEEARDVLAPVADEERRAQLVELCHGWPAVLGLAARAPGPSPPQDVLLDGLYDYFAEELFQSASPELQRLLCQISAAPCLTRNLLERLDGPPAFDLAATAERDGFFHRTEKGEQSLHPLLRAFLEHRLNERSDRVQLVDDLTQALLENERWDDVWQLIQDRDRPDLLPRLIESSLPTLLDGSRLPALESWIAFGHANSLVSPLLDLAEAEVSFLAGEHTKAYALALQATHHFDDSSPVRWRAHAIAGRSGHYSDRLSVAIDHLRKARSIAPNRKAVLHCLWTEFLCAYELESEDCVSTLDQLIALQDGRPETTVRIVQAKMFLSKLVGIGSDELPFIENALSLLDRVHPQVRASFYVTYCDYLTGLARYSDAEPALLKASTLLSDYGYSFGYPSNYCNRAVNAIGLRRYRHAELLLDAAERSTDAFRGSIPLYVSALRDIVALIKADRNDYLSPTSAYAPAPKFWQGLALGINALKCACRGDMKTAITYASNADSTTRHSETRTLTAFARAIIAIQSNSAEASSVLADALLRVNRCGQWNQFVWAYRAYPDLLARIASEPKLATQIGPILLSAYDGKLADRFGIPLPAASLRQSQAEGKLSRREREILQLVADGLSNKEISRKLFISEVTVKVHLRHTYEKLGVRNRMEAALHAVYSD